MGGIILDGAQPDSSTRKGSTIVDPDHCRWHPPVCTKFLGLGGCAIIVPFPFDR